MDENRVEGTAKNIGGKVQEGFGRVTGDTKSQVEGIANQAAGATQDLYGQAADTARDTALTFDKWLRNQIETQPYTTALAAVGIGWLLGRLHRPTVGRMTAGARPSAHSSGQMRTASGSMSKRQALPRGGST